MYLSKETSEILGSDPAERREVGFGRFFETMVFETGDSLAENEECGCREVLSWCEIDMNGYNTAGDAQRGHEEMVEKYMKIADESEPA